MDLERISLEVAALSQKVGQFIREEAGRLGKGDIWKKGLHDFVTYVDIESEKQIVSQLKKLLPEAGFVAEEQQSLERKEAYNWIIDPLDGTTNFIHGIPAYCVSIALERNGQLVSGVVYEINRDECFVAWEDGPALLNGNKIQVSSTTKLEESLIATGFPYSDYSLLPQQMKLLEDLLVETRGVRRLGSAALDLAYVACGRFDLFFEYALNPWDVAAGSLIVERAGGYFSDFHGKTNNYSGKQIIASNKYLHPAFMKKLKYHFGKGI